MIIQVCVGSSCHIKGSPEIVELLQKAVEIQPDDTPEVLQRRVMEQAEWILLPQATEMLSKQISEE